MYIPPERYDAPPDDLPAETALAEAIRLCGSEGFAPALFRYLQVVTAADNLVILAFRGEGRPLVLFRRAEDPHVFGHLETGYLAGAYLLDPMHELHRNGADPGVYRLVEVAPDAFHRSRYFEEYYRQTTILDELCFLVRLGADLSVTLCLGRDGRSGRVFSARSLEAGKRIAPIILALSGQHWRDLPQTEGRTTGLVQGVARALQAQHGIGLSPRQAEVALLILQGHSTASIALRLRLSGQTVKVFRRQIYARCRISSQGELFKLMLPLLNGVGGA